MPQVSVSALVAGVRSGAALVSFPTDTLPALAARPDRADLIFAAKQRSVDKPLILMTATVAELWNYVAGSPAERQIWQQVAVRYLPGALTLVLPASDRVPAAMNPQNPTSIGVRVPNHAIAQALLQQTGAVATTSANRSGQPALLTMAEIEQQFPQVLTLSPRELQSFSQFAPSEPASMVKATNLPSTVVLWTGTDWKIVRQGAIAFEG